MNMSPKYRNPRATPYFRTRGAHFGPAEASYDVAGQRARPTWGDPAQCARSTQRAWRDRPRYFFTQLQLTSAMSQLDVHFSAEANVSWLSSLASGNFASERPR